MSEAQLTADYFDGYSARARRVRVVARAGRLEIFDAAGAGEAPDAHAATGASQAASAAATPLRSLAYSEVRWPERTRHGARVAHLAGGGELHALASADWDAFVAGAGLRESLLVRSQQSWRAVLAASVLLLALVAAGWRWGVPALADATLAVLPESIDAQVGTLAFEQIEARWLEPSKLPAAQQQALCAAFEDALRRAAPDAAPWRLEFRASDIGPNAFALPGGTIVMTDELVRLVEGDEAVIVGVLAHEYGHVRGRHGMRQLVQASLLGAATSLAFGDFSGLLAAAPALLGTLGYSRELEREADGESIRILQAAGRNPAAMVSFFEKVGEWRPGRGPTDEGNDGNDAGGETGQDGKAKGDDASPLGIAFSSHPADAERIARFRAAALR